MCDIFKDDRPILTVLFRLKAIGILNSIEGIQGKCRSIRHRQRIVWSGNKNKWIKRLWGSVI